MARGATQPEAVRVAAIHELGRVTTEFMRNKQPAAQSVDRVMVTLCVLATGRPSAGSESEPSIDDWLQKKGYGLASEDPRPKPPVRAVPRRRAGAR